MSLLDTLIAWGYVKSDEVLTKEQWIRMIGIKDSCDMIESSVLYVLILDILRPY